MATRTAKLVQVIARYTIKRNGHVVYLVRSSSGKEQYTTTLVNGKATGCSCPAHGRCYHRTQLEQREQERIAQAETEAANKARAMAQAREARLAQIDAWAHINADAARYELAPLNGNRAFSILR
jgi:hypothetical protein